MKYIGHILSMHHAMGTAFCLNFMHFTAWEFTPPVLVCTTLRGVQISIPSECLRPMITIVAIVLFAPRFAHLVLLSAKILNVNISIHTFSSFLRSFA